MDVLRLSLDIGRQTQSALCDLRRIIESGDYEALELLNFEAKEDTNGNGSLMRILPLYFYLADKGLEANFKIIWEVSALTHPHIRSALACLIYLIMIDELINQDTIKTAYKATQDRTKAFFVEHNTNPEEQTIFKRLIDQDIATLPRDSIKSSGYVVDTLEASFWSLLTTDSFATAVLTAVNLGEDTDTTGAVAGRPSPSILRCRKNPS